MGRGAVVEQREQFGLESGRDRESWNERMEKVMDYGLRLVGKGNGRGCCCRAEGVVWAWSLEGIGNRGMRGWRK